MRLVLLAGVNSAILLRPIAQADGGERPWLEQQVRRARQITPEPVVVLSGRDADDILRSCRSLERCELVFDTNDDAATLLTNAKAGLTLVSDPCLLHAAEVPFPDHETLQALVRHFHQLGPRHPADILQGVDHNGCLVNWGFPLVVLPAGRRKILKPKALQGLADPALAYEHVGVDGITKLASEGTSN